MGDIDAWFLKKQTEDTLEIIRSDGSGTMLTAAQAEMYIAHAWYGMTPPNLIFIKIRCASHEKAYMTQNINGHVKTIERYI